MEGRGPLGSIACGFRRRWAAGALALAICATGIAADCVAASAYDVEIPKAIEEAENKQSEEEARQRTEEAERQEREKREAEERAAAASQSPSEPASQPSPTPPVSVSRQPASVCIVPNLRGASVNAARTKLTAGDCALGHVKRPRGHAAGALIVVSQSKQAGAKLVVGYKVNIVLGVKHARHGARKQGR